MDTISAYALTSLAWLTIQSLPLLFWPTLISTLLTADVPGRHGGHSHRGHACSTSTEQYFARSLGLAQLSLGIILLVLSGVLPLASISDDPSSTTPYLSAATLITTLYHASTAFYAYTRYISPPSDGGGQTAYLLGCAGSTVLAACGLSLVLFGAGSSPARVSRRTGADKATSGWPFRNVEADKKKEKGGKRL